MVSHEEILDSDCALLKNAYYFEILSIVKIHKKDMEKIYVKYFGSFAQL